MTSSIYGTAASAARITGMMSGLDTDNLVKGMTASITSKIQKQQQALTKLEWKQDAYRGLTTSLQGFQSKYLDYTKSTNALSSSFYNVRTMDSSGKYSSAVTVSGYSSSASKLAIEKITRLATATNAITGNEVANKKITIDGIDFTGDIPVNELAGKIIDIQYGYDDDGAVKGYRLQIDDDFVGTSITDLVDHLQDKIEAMAIEWDSNGDPTAYLDSLINITHDGGGNIVWIPTDPSEDFTVIGGSAALLEALGGLAADDDLAGGAVWAFNGANIVTHYGVGDLTGKSVSFTLNGVTKKISIDAYTSDSTWEAAWNQALTNAFGAGKVTASLVDNLDGTHSLSFVTVGNSDILTLSGADSFLTSNQSVMKVTTGASNRVNTAQALNKITFKETLLDPTSVDDTYDITINGETFSFKATDSLSSILRKINNSDAGVTIEYLETSNTFGITCKDTGALGTIDISATNGDAASESLIKALFGGTSYGSGSAGYSQGQDAEFTINYGDGSTPQVVTRSTNTFTLDGITLTLNEEFDALGVKADFISFGSSVDATDLVSKIVAMVNEYNSIMSTVTAHMTTRPDKNYYPLTDEKKEDMTDSQIADWEKKAQAGILYGDSLLRGLSQDMRFIFSLNVPGVGNVADFGITASDKYEEYGQLSVDEAKLKAAIEADPDGFMDLFLAGKEDGAASGTTDQGIIGRMNDLMDKYISTVGANKGSLITMAGYENYYLNHETQLSKQMETIKSTIERLEKQLETQQTRYYKQFTALEKYIANMSAQSSWLNDLYG